LSGSTPAALHVPHPHDQIVATLSSAATSFAASASHLTTRYQSVAGSSRSRPPAPGVDWKPSISPMRDEGTPIASRSETRVRRVVRTRRLPSCGPCLKTDGPEK